MQGRGGTLKALSVGLRERDVWELCDYEDCRWGSGLGVRLAQGFAEGKGRVVLGKDLVLVLGGFL